MSLCEESNILKAEKKELMEKGVLGVDPEVVQLLCQCGVEKETLSMILAWAKPTGGASEQVLMRLASAVKRKPSGNAAVSSVLRTVW